MEAMFLQAFELNYSGSDALRTRKVVRNALIDIIEKGRKTKTEWNVKVSYKTPGRKKGSGKRHRRARGFKVSRKLISNG